MTGKPLRFLAATLGCWTAVRVALLWPTIDSVPALIRSVVPPASASPIAFFAEAPTRAAGPHARAVRTPPARAAAMLETPALVAAPAAPASPVATSEPPVREASPLRAPALAQAPDRLTASLWIVARGGTAESRPGAQLGGAQAGMRLTYALGSARRVALAARLSSPLAGGAPEVALGIDWQPSHLPVHLIAEQRIGTGRVRGGPAVLLVGGIDPRPLVAGFDIEGYAQTGAVARDRLDAFADGALRVSRPVATIGGQRLAVGAGVWGGVQRGVGRLDVGPQLALPLPVAGRAMRLTLDWRQRVAGNARPGSGAVLTLGADF